MKILFIDLKKKEMINRVILCGRLTKDVEIRKTTSGKTVIAYTLAVERDKEHTDFINCVAWNKLAELMSQYTHKGDMVAIEGKLNTRSYDNQYGSKTYITEVVADSVQFLSYKKSAEQQSQASNTNTYNQPQQAQNQPQRGYTQQSLTQQAEQLAFNDSSEPLDINSDDLPF